MSQSQPSMREVAHRVFAREFSEATYTFRESDEDRAPVYALLPTGAKANRIFIVGTLTETEDLGDDTEYWRGRVVDPVSTFFVYAGQYQPEAAGLIREFEPPGFVAVVGKPRTFETDSGTVNVSVQPESITVVDEQTRNRWVVETAERTIDRIERFDDPGNEYAQMAREQYDVTIETFRQDAIEALESLDSSETATESETDEGPESDSSESENEATTAESEIPSDDGDREDKDDAPTIDSEVVMTYLHELGDGDAVDREALITAVCDDRDVASDEVESAITDALDSGQCFRSSEDELTPI